MRHQNQNDFKFVIRVTWVVILLCLCAVGTLTKMYLWDNYSGSAPVFLVMSVPLLISSLVFIMVLYSLRKTYSAGITELKDGQPLVKWTYKEDEWREFNYDQWKKSRRKAVLYPFGFLMAIMVFALLDPESDGVAAIVFPYLAVFFITLAMAMYYYSRVLYKRTTVCPREVVIGPKGFLYGGYYNTWEGVGTRFGGAKLITGGITCIEFNIQVRGRYGYNSRPVRVPVPAGGEQSASVLVEEIVRLNT